MFFQVFKKDFIISLKFYWKKKLVSFTDMDSISQQSIQSLIDNILICTSHCSRCCGYITK